jgi:hypothetical protein
MVGHLRQRRQQEKVNDIPQNNRRQRLDKVHEH